MARQMIMENVKLFSGLKSRFVDLDNIDGVVEKVCVSTDGFNKSFIKDASYIGKVQTYWVSVLGFYHQSVLYFVLVDVSQDKDIDLGVYGEEIDLIEGLFVLTGSEVDLFGVSDALVYELYNELFHEEESDYDRNGVRYLPLNALQGRTRDLRVFCSDSEEIIDHNIFLRLSASIIARSIRSGRSSRYKFNDAIVMLCESGSDKIPYDCIINSVISVGWQHAFLELYRCIEYLYGLPESKKLKSKISSVSSAAQLLDHLRSQISWKPREAESLLAVLECLNPSVLDRLGVVLLEKENCSLPDIAKKFYALRNSIVHFRSGQSATVLTDQNWEELCVVLCDIIVDCYTVYEIEMLRDEQ